MRFKTTPDGGSGICEVSFHQRVLPDLVIAVGSWLTSTINSSEALATLWTGFKNDFLAMIAALDDVVVCIKYCKVINAVYWLDGGSVNVAQMLKQNGAAVICCDPTSGPHIDLL